MLGNAAHLGFRDLPSYSARAETNMYNPVQLHTSSWKMLLLAPRDVTSTKWYCDSEKRMSKANQRNTSGDADDLEQVIKRGKLRG